MNFDFAQAVAIVILVLGWAMTVSRSLRILLAFFNWQTMSVAIYIFLAFRKESERALVPALIFLTIFFFFRILVIQRIISKRADKPGRRMPHGWLEYGKTSIGLPAIGTSGLLLTVLSFSFAYQLGIASANPLAVGLGIILLGLLVMLTREDLLAQSIGLIMLENGLYLSGVALVVQSETLFLLFTLGAIFYLVVTLFTIGFLLKYIQQGRGSLNLNELRNLKG